MNFFLENLRNPARDRRAGAMRQFRPGQLDSRSNAPSRATKFSTKFPGTNLVRRTLGACSSIDACSRASSGDRVRPSPVRTV
jgi:hypothetical protein